MGGRKGDREIILGVVIEHIFKYIIIQKIFARKYYKMATLQKFEAGKKKKIYVIVISKLRLNFQIKRLKTVRVVLRAVLKNHVSRKTRLKF